ncbi:hypothetical protein Dimus_022971 [Dionaea muscipula]
MEEDNPQKKPDHHHHHHHHIRVLEWESGLPLPEDLTPLSQSLITPELASAFGITPEPSRSLIDLNRASHDTYSTICRTEGYGFELGPPLKLFPDSEGCKVRRVDVGDEVNSGSNASKEEIVHLDENGVSRAVKRPRLVWTPQLHKRFVDVIEQLGVDKAVPKTIMEMMNVEGLTRENVASHLQKYRLYLKRVEGSPSEGQMQQRGGTPKSSVSSGYDGAGNGYHGQMQQQHCGSVPPLMPIPLISPAAAAASYGYGHGHGHAHSHSHGHGHSHFGFNVGTGALESRSYNNMFWNRQRG